MDGPVLFPIWPPGAAHFVDVRDVAACTVASLHPGLGPRRYVVPGTHARGQEFFSAIATMIGRRRPHVAPPRPVVLGLAHSMRVPNALLPKGLHYPADPDGIHYWARDTRFDDSPAREELGVLPRPFEASLSDTVHWLVDAGHLPERLRPR